MSDEKRRVNQQNTGTVPKIKCRNNTRAYGEKSQERENLQTMPNNLSLGWGGWIPRRSESNITRNSERMNFIPIDMDYHHQNGNGTTTPSQSSSSNSRRNSTGTVPKCDNVTKYPSKKQIEDKLNQIREYLQITTSLMSTMKNGDDQDQEENDNLKTMYRDLKDSESKLLNLLELQKDENPENMENVSNRKNDLDQQTNKEMDMLKEQRLSLQYLQQKAESRLHQARQIQDKMYQDNSLKTHRRKNNSTELDVDLTMHEIDERNKRLNESNNINAQESRLNSELEELEKQIQVMHSANEDRNQLIDLLDKRDAELRNQHMELQNKLSELQTKKMQVDHLVSQLQSVPQDDDMGSQVKKIVGMKDQLSKLKDMLELVQSTESSMCDPENQAVISEVYAKAENLLNKDFDKVNISNQSQLENYGNCSSSSSLNDNRNRQFNKNTGQICNGAKPKVSEKLALQAELKAKKKELEEIMGKHKACSSNLNQDVGTDNKSEFSCSNSIFDNGSGIYTPTYNQLDICDRYSSDGTEELLPPAFGERNVAADRKPLLDYQQPREFRGNSQTKHSSGKNSRADSGDRSDFRRGQSISNLSQHSKQNMQKQLDMMTSLCDSMLSSNLNASNRSNINMQQQNVHQLRNNLTPSPIYTELRSFVSPNASSSNALNVINQQSENAWPSVNGPMGDMANYQNWLATNTLQTQAFMLNTLNQCCQMLWLQQRELAALRNVVTGLQQEPTPNQNHLNDIGETRSVNQLSGQPSCLQLNQCQRPGLNSNNQKTAQVSSACSLPNLNQYNASLPGYSNHNNLQMLDSCMNNFNTLNEMRGENIQPNSNNPIGSVPQLWNEQALNNQVPPGNRANNYWDNFRSYSRQNLLSNKSNEGPQNSLVDRTHNTLDRPNPFEVHPIPKSNMQQLSPQENVPPPQRSCVKPCRRYPNTNIAVVPPDVLNINQNIKNEGLPSLPVIQNETPAVPISSINNAYQRRSSTVRENQRESQKRNPSNDLEEFNQRTKLFEELKENVYKEVASLISANEARPHFLIQLFRDLQHISSDPLRLKTLQSIQVVISQSINASQRANQNQTPQPSTLGNQEIEFSLQSTVWPPLPSETSPSVSRNANLFEGLLARNVDIPQHENVFNEIIPFLNENEHIVINRQFLDLLNQKILESKSFKRIVKDNIFQKHFSNVLEKVLIYYLDQPLMEVKTLILNEVRGLLTRELSFMNLIQGTCENHMNDLVSSTVSQGNINPLPDASYTNGPENAENSLMVQIQNEDLAEADQSHVEGDDIEEEGAVGGFIEVSSEVIHLPQAVPDETANEVIPNGNYPATSTESESQYQMLQLDQVPTRLPMKSKSRSNTPNKDRTSSRQDGDPDHL